VMGLTPEIVTHFFVEGRRHSE
jgi:uncharacterized protein YndB with AHSA1/START domain/predicted small metal-binding protein